MSELLTLPVRSCFTSRARFSRRFGQCLDVIQSVVMHLSHGETLQLVPVNAGLHALCECCRLADARAARCRLDDELRLAESQPTREFRPILLDYKS